MMRYGWVLLVVLLLSWGAAGAQEPEGAINIPPTAPLEAIKWGMELLPYPEWNVSLNTNPLAVESVWKTNDPVPPVVVYRREFGDNDATLQEISDLVNVRWLNILLADYENWVEVSRCLGDEVVTVDLGLVFAGSPFVARYWLWSQEGALVSVFAVYSLERATELETLADQAFNAAARCS